MDTWTPEWNNPLTTDYRVIVRPWERSRGGYWFSPWTSYWNQHRQALCGSVDNHMAWPGKPNKSQYLSSLEQGQISFGLCFCPCSNDLEDLFRVGVGILLWSHSKLPPALKRHLQGQTLDTLPEQVRYFRNNTWMKTQDTGALCLVWDDPHRLPKDHDQLLTDIHL